MSLLQMISDLYFIVVILIFVLLQSKGKKKYAKMVEPLDKDEFGLKALFPAGFVVMEMTHYRYTSKNDRDMRRKLRELYEPDYAEYYLRVYWASSMTYLLLGFFASALLWFAMGYLGLVFGLVLGIILAIVNFRAVDSKIEKRHLSIQMDMPDFTNKILILSGAGMTIRASIIKIAHEMSNDAPLYHELAYSVHMMEMGSTDEEALNHMAMRCNTAQMRRFVSVIIQNLHRGGSDVILALQSIGDEQWQERKDAAMKVSAEADTKLLFPMMLMLGAVIVMTVAPAVMSLGI